jgi:hypothetical protein
MHQFALAFEHGRKLLYRRFRCIRTRRSRSMQVEGSANRYSAFSIWDRGNDPITGDVLEAVQRIKALPTDQQDAAWRRFAAGQPRDHQRIFFGRAEDKYAELRLKDTDGRDRIVIEVNPDGVCVLNRQNDGQGSGSISWRCRLEEARNPGRISTPP